MDGYIYEGSSSFNNEHQQNILLVWSQSMITGQCRLIRTQILPILFFFLILIAHPACADVSQEIYTKEFSPYIAQGQIVIYSLNNVSNGDIITVSAERVSGNIDPAIGLTGANVSITEILAQYQRSIQQARDEGQDQVKAVTDVADQHFLAWDDDSGSGYTATFSYDIPESGNYALMVMGNPLSENRGDCRVKIIVRKNPNQHISKENGITPDIHRNTTFLQEDKRLQVLNGTLLAGESVQYYILSPVRKGETFYLHANPNNNIPFRIKLKDFGGKVLATGDYLPYTNGTTLRYTFKEQGKNYKLEVLPKETEVADQEIPFTLVAGINTPSILTGDTTERGITILEQAIPVRIGVEMDQITGVNQKEENFAIVGNIWMQWSDPALAFYPHSCNCSKKTYRSIEEFTKAEGSRWPDFTIYNQQERRWTQNVQIQVFPTGKVIYYERFWDQLQAPDFDFKKYPFDTQNFYIRIDSIFPQDMFRFVAWPEKTRVGDQLGEEEWIITSNETNISTVYITDDNSRYSFHFTAVRQIQYYLFRVIIPILIIIILTYISFLLNDYGKRADISSANLLILVAYSFMIGDDIPHVGYLTFLDIILVISFIITGVTVIYNFYLKWIADAKTKSIAERIDRVMVWLYPVIYLVSIIILVVSERTFL